MSPRLKSTLKTIHRMGGLLVAAFVLFYALTGIMLNHRKAFSYFYRLRLERHSVPISDAQKVREFVEHYKAMIKREDDPTVIKIRDTKTIEFLYGSHGVVRYTIRPEVGEVVRAEKVFIEPLNRVNNVLHKAVRTGTLWVVFSDAFSGILILSTITGLFILRYRAMDVILLLTGTVLLSVLAVIG